VSSIPGSSTSGTTTGLNVVDSCGWLEYFANGPNAEFFQPALWDTARLLVPAVSIFEVCRRVLALSGADAARQVYKAMTVPRVVQLDARALFEISQAAREHRLALADALIWKTAQVEGALLWTQDADLSHLPGVAYRAKAPAGAS
jgi:predicted nucleic acid-binding protein